MRLDGRVVVVTGASSGIGQAIADRCVAEGASVVATGRRAEALEAVGSGSDRVARIAADLADDGAPERVVALALERFGKLDGLVHAAGTVWRNEDLRESSDAAVRSFVDSNLTATIRMARAAYTAMTTGGGGSIVLIGSQLAHIAVPGYATYCATKGAVIAFARALAIDGGPLGVRVNVVSPGLVRTPMAYVDREDFDEAAPAIALRHPLRRIGEPADMAGPAVFLLSDDAAWMTAQTMIVDGGFTAT
jgi:NAD(P)-dependent dehydrogenase (short-subunit alcohol dehydrogenase family)